MPDSAAAATVGAAPEQAGPLKAGQTLFLLGDALTVLRGLPDDHFDCVVTSPPYWGLRDYGVEGQLGLEPTLGEHIAAMVALFREVRRVLKPGGTVWLNYGDCYATSPNGRSAAATKAAGGDDRTFRDKPFSTVGPIDDPAGPALKATDLCMVPNRLAIALQDDGWWVRAEIVWAKPNPMPESSRGRPATAHEKIFLLTKAGDKTNLWNHEVTNGWREAKPEPDWWWKHAETHAWVATEPAPDWRWKHREKGTLRDSAPALDELAGWEKVDAWRKVNAWRGFASYYDLWAVRQGRIGDEDAVGFRGGSYVGGAPGTRATVGNSKVPAGWDQGAGGHGTIHRTGRNDETRGRDTYGRHTLGAAVPEEERRDYEHSPGLQPPHKGLQRARDEYKKQNGHGRRHAGFNARWDAKERGLTPRHSHANNHTALDSVGRGGGRNLRNYEPAPLDVWVMATRPFTEAHFATFPAELVERCLLAGCPEGGLVLDPFGGAGTVGLVAEALQREATLIELNPAYVEIAEARLAKARVQRLAGKPDKARRCDSTGDLFGSEVRSQMTEDRKEEAPRRHWPGEPGAI